MKSSRESEFARTAPPACTALVLLGGMVRLFGTLGADTLTDKVIGCCMQWVCVVNARRIGLTTDLKERGGDVMNFKEYKQKVFTERPDVKREYEKLGEPLSLEALRGMKNEPVYLHVFDKNLESGWHIIKTVTQGKIIFRGWNKVYVSVEGLGKDYNLYCYHPIATNLQQTCNEVATDTDVGSTLKEWEPCDECRNKCCFNCLYDNLSMQSEPCNSCDGDKWETKHLFCPNCGRPLTPEACAMQEKRLRGARR